MNNRSVNIKVCFLLFCCLLSQIIHSSIILTNNDQFNSVSLDITFEEYIIQFNKIYPTQESKEYRRQIYQNNIIELREIVKTCQVCGVTKYTDWNKDQRKTLRGQISSQFAQEQHTHIKGAGKISSTPISLPKNFDWRDHKVITSIKEQQCGNCWAYSTAAFFESQIIRRGQASNTLDLSEQYFMQCDKQSSSCNGGWMQTAIDIGLTHGVPLEADYPVNLQKNYSDICQATKVITIPKTKQIAKIKIQDDQIIELLMKRPLGIVIDSTGWEDYVPTKAKRAISCVNSDVHPSQLDHAVLLVGYTETEWIIKNQWGTDIGVNGYFYVSRDPKTNCGVGIQVHTLDYQLPSINAPSIPVNPTVIINQPATCNISHCLQCDKGGDSCTQCQSGYEINSGECSQISGQAQTNDTYDYYPQVPDLMTTCIDTNCYQCQINDNNEEECVWCNKGYGINQASGNCQQSPIEGCNYFQNKRKLTICYECHDGYDLQGFNKCASNIDLNQQFIAAGP